jgi:hypothetical protein
LDQSANEIQLVYRISWLRAKCQAARWQEELKLLRMEMDWTKCFFANKSSACLSWISETSRVGHVAYAERQSTMWTLLHSQASSAFGAAIQEVQVAQAKLEAGGTSTNST